MKKMIYRILSAFLMLATAQSIAFSQDSAKVNDLINLQAQKLKFILEKAYANYHEPIDIEKTAEAGLKAMLEHLDIQSKYYSKEDYIAVKESNTGQNVGPGVTVVNIKDTNVVSSVVEGSPAEKAGLHTGDKIIYINGENVIGHSLPKINSLLIGPKDSKLTVVVKRGYTGILNEFTLERKETKVPSILAAFVIPGTETGYIKIRNFSFKADEEFEQSLQSLQNQKIQALILDLRSNPGGAISDVAEIAGSFMQDTLVVAKTQARNNEFIYNYKPKKVKKILDLPIIVIVDENSASASEILAGALQDFDRALVVGKRSFGKGSVQRFWEFKDGSAFRLTVGHYTTPLGRKIEKTAKQKQVNDKDFNALVRDLAAAGSLRTVSTPGKRVVFEGGGVIPDAFIQDDTTTALTTVLINNNIINEYIYSYLDSEAEKIRKQYKDSPELFLKDFTADDKMLENLKTVSYSRKIWNEEMYKADKEYIRIFVKAAIAHALWGNKAFYPIFIKADKAVKNALELMPEAEKLIKK